MRFSTNKGKFVFIICGRNLVWNHDLREIPIIKRQTSTGYIACCRFGYIHNLMGPAIIHIDGIKSYYLKGRSLSKKEWEIEKLKYED